ncbi:MAG: arsenate reductase ArsC [Syntrophorhabdales bacterium]|jgi:arsenate reductase
MGRNENIAKDDRPERKKVLFFCACNSIRSQMAEGLLRALHGDKYESFSAGIRPETLSPGAVRAMAELGIDISGQSAKGIEAFVGVRFDCIAMVCGDPKGPCPFLPDQGFACKGCFHCCALHPFFPSAPSVIHGTFKNLADLESDGEIEPFRKIRDEIRDWLEEHFN